MTALPTVAELNFYDLTCQVLELVGPVGGNSLVRLVGSREQLHAWLDEVYEDVDGVHHVLVREVLS